jgi:hypothetical protein
MRLQATMFFVAFYALANLLTVIYTASFFCRKFHMLVNPLKALDMDQKFLTFQRYVYMLYTSWVTWSFLGKDNSPLQFCYEPSLILSAKTSDLVSISNPICPSDIKSNSKVLCQIRFESVHEYDLNTGLTNWIKSVYKWGFCSEFVFL